MYMFQYLNFRILPSVAFYEYDLNYHYTDGQPPLRELKDATMMELPLLFKYKSVRRINTAMYILGGINPSLEAAGRGDEGGTVDKLKLKNANLAIDVGAGFDIYFHYFKLSPEIRYSFGLRNMLDEKTNQFTENLVYTDVHSLTFDVRDRKATMDAISGLPENWKHVQVLINNAGNAHGMDTIQNGNPDDWEAMIDINVKGLLYVSKAVIENMVKHKSGHIVNIGSLAGVDVYPKGNVYNASKFAVDALTRGMRMDLNEHGIKVSEVKPGLVKTEFSEVRFKGDKEKASKVYDGFKPLVAEDVAEVVKFVISRPAHVNVADLLLLPTAQVTIGEINVDLAKSKFPEANVIPFNIEDVAASSEKINESDLVISMLPANLHPGVAEICADHGIHLLTASYLKDDVQSLDDQFKKKGALCLMETGLDPGLDHMSAMKVLNRIKAENGKLTGFETFTGGLLAEDEEKNNPTLYRGTLRRPGFCRAWNIFVQLGATDDSYQMENVDQLTHRQFINSFLSYNPHDSIELKLAHYLNLGLESEEMFKLKWLGLFDDELVGLNEGTPAQVLEHILKKKWTLNSDDRDMIVMWHQFDFLVDGRPKQIQSHMVVTGENDIDTAMSKTVGLPLGIAAKLIMTDAIKTTGVHLPTSKEIYDPVLADLAEMGFEFMERETIS
ncbi:ydfG [Symbiodinium microadriaticum]|nr:ydfG [Symbiodinium microadriaticum]